MLKRKKQEKIFLESGEEFTPELEAELVAEAERGYDLSKAKLHVRTRPLLPGSPIPEIALRLSEAEIDAVQRRVEKEGRPFGDVVRELKRRTDS
ncbi:MAG TPA: hypothetical protein VLI94_01300 [Solirubrobacterales bacterium]|nr:hypothetical protein [Solirubrobacterales bacterium]